MDHDLNIRLKTLLKSCIDRTTLLFKIDQADLEGIDNRIQVELKDFEEKLSEMGLSLQKIESDMNNGLLIYHKYRSNNVIGGKVINQTVFRLDSSKALVENAYTIE